jgi:hypothetical protein
MARVNSKRHAKPTAAALSERTYRHVLAFKRTLLNQMAHIRLDIAAARREDREHMKTLIDHCARLLREKETLQRQLAIATALSYTIKQGPIESHFHAPDDQCDSRCHVVAP